MIACINLAVQKGTITKEQGKVAKATYRSIRDQLMKDMNAASANLIAPKRTAQAIKREISAKRWRDFKQMSRENDIARAITDSIGDEVPTLFGIGIVPGGILGKKLGKVIKHNDGVEALNMIENFGAEARLMSAEQYREAIEGRAHAMIEEILFNSKRNLRGVTRKKATLADMERELFGEATGNAHAKAYADAWREAAEYVRLEYNAAGGSLDKTSLI